MNHIIQLGLPSKTLRYLLLLGKKQSNRWGIGVNFAHNTFIHINSQIKPIQKQHTIFSQEAVSISNKGITFFLSAYAIELLDHANQILASEKYLKDKQLTTTEFIKPYHVPQIFLYYLMIGA